MNKKGFTLIELMVVVAIIGIISAILVPRLARQFAAEDELIKPQQQLKQTAAEQTAHSQREQQLPGIVPRLQALVADIELETGHRLDGLKVHTWYDAAFSGTFVWQTEQAGAVKLVFPFPAGAVGARDVSLRIADSEGNFIEPAGVIYALQGIYWRGEVTANTELTAKVTYRASGFDRFTYRLPGDGRTPEIRVKLKIKGKGAHHVPATALQPSAEAERLLTWQFTNLVTHQRDIVLDLPAVMSPVGRVILLAKLAGLAVFMFGAGFWYMAETRQAGGLSNFRWGHFSLLALSYFLFFVIFAVLQFRYRTPAPLGMGIAILLSMPLLVLHVSSSLGGALRFALTHILPLALFTLGLVVNGVYGGEYREYIYIAAAVVALAYFTLTYQSWAAGRRAYREAREEEFQQDVQQRALDEKREALRQTEHDCVAYLSNVQGWLADNSDQGLQVQRRRVDRAVAAVEACRAKIANLATHDSTQRLQDFAHLHTTLTNAFETLQQQAETLLEQRQAQLEQQEKNRQRRENDIQAALKNLAHQLRVAEKLDSEAEAAGLTEQRQALAEVLAGEDFSTALESLQDLADDVEHQRRGQELKRRIERHGSRAQALNDAVRDALARQSSHARHCLACGATVPPGKFCLNCGAAQPEQLDCKHCGQVYALPRHLVALWPPPAPLHCPACGKQYED